MIVAVIVNFVAQAILTGWLTHTVGRPAPLSTPELKQLLAKAQARLWAWEIEYESSPKERPGVLAGSYLHRIVAAKAPDRFFHWNAHGSPRLDWPDDPFQQRLTVTAERLISERPLDRCFIQRRLRPDDPLPGTAPRELLLIGLGWWPLAQRPPPLLVDGLPAALSAVAQSLKYRARPDLEQVGGRWCQLLECPGRDQIWLDVERGCAVAVRQITYSRPNQVHRIEFADFRELLPKVWVPFTVHNLIYERKSDGIVGKAVLDATLHVRQVRLNEAVDDGRFEFKPLPGSVAEIEHQPLRQVISGGEEYLDEVVEWVRRYRPKMDIPKSQVVWANWRTSHGGRCSVVPESPCCSGGLAGFHVGEVLHARR